jgi:hypothetical protein
VTIEPGIADMVHAATAAAAKALAAPDWPAYGTCPICRAGAGEPCTSVFGRIVAGRPVDGAAVLPVAHGHRKRRRGR